MTTTRWYCAHCGIVRDLHEGTDIAWCHHGVTNGPPGRMMTISPHHPYATGPLPWGTADPTVKAGG